MTQQNCKPCQGIQSITPRPLVNLIGQHQLNYRVGDYSAFYETMLAALSRNLLPTELLQNIDSIGLQSNELSNLSNQQPSPLRYLTARDKDDPSIAMLDAWAVLADLLTFYNERYLNEAYLSTATQAPSLFELANMVGYAPRPGLSSSVYLAFEVDDRGEEVLIQAGTPAKSTPIPGSGQTPETFETSRPIIGRPSFNKIRPRLTRPQNLRPSNLRNLDRIYIKGIGLRIQPNDVLAIGAKEAGEPVFRRVIRIDERRETVQGPVTVIILEEDELSITKLTRETTTACTNFFKELEQQSFVDQSRIKTMNDYVSQIVTKADQSGYASGLAEAHKILHRDLLLNSLIEKSNPIRKDIEAIDSTLAGLAAPPRSTKTLLETLDSTYAGGLAVYKVDLQSILNLIAPIGNLLKTNISPASTTSVISYERNLYSLCPLSSQPRVFHAVSSGFLTNTTPAIDIQVVSQPAAANLTVQIERKVGPAIPLQTNVPWSAAESAIQAAMDPANSAVFFAVYEGTTNLVTAGVKVSVSSGIKTPEQILIADSSSGIPIAGNLDLQDPSGNPEFTYTIHHLDNGQTLVAEQATPEILSTTLTSLRAESVDLPSGVTRGTYLITINKGTTKFGFFLRTVLYDDVPKYLRKIGAEYLCGIRDNTNVIQAISLIENTISGSIADGNLNLTTAHSKLTPISDFLNEKYPQSIEDYLSKLRTSMIDVGAAVSGRIDSTLGVNLAALLMDIGKFSSLTPGGSSPAAIEKCISDLRANCLLARDLGTKVVQRFVVLLNEIRGVLSRRTSIVVNRLESAETEAKPNFGDVNSAEKEVKQLLEKLFSTGGSLDDSIKKRAIDFSVSMNFDTDINTVRLMHCSLDEIQDALQVVATDIGSKKTQMSGRGLKAADTLLGLWKATSDLVSTSTTTSASNATVSANDLSSILGELLKDNTGSSSLGSIANIVSIDSSVWIQVLSALNPLERKQLVQFLSRLRKIGTASEGNLSVWIIRSTASVFGWNSPGVIQSVTVVTRAPLVETTVTTSTKSDPPSDFLSEHARVEDRIFLDGKYSGTLVDAPIGVRITSDGEIKGYWVTRTATEPHTAYGLSSESTVVQFATGSAWYGTVPKCDTVRTSKVFCDAEKLELAEAFLADDLRERFLEGGDSKRLIQLNDFYPYLSPGKVAFSGLPAKKSPLAVQTPQTGVRVSELLDVASVHHKPPVDHGDSIKTEIELIAPLANIYWRDSVEICANVVEATHGETVPEVLGSGDARKPFQKFPLRRAPLTRLPASTKDGKEDQLEITVHNTRWDKVAHLVHSGASDEVYELTGNRNNANSTVQFGSGINGARLPTGVENVKALYRVGLGVAGNVEPGQINQLPSPPFGVKGVTNPLRGDGGANADSIAQTRLRIPAMASGMRTLVSLDDYKNFALLFAGIDKVSVESRSGQITMYVAGCAPDPLDKQGSLFRNLVSAFEQLGDDGALVQLEPHQGLLLHIDASVSVDSRHDWEPVKAAIEKALLLRFGYPQAQLGKSISASDVVRTIQSVDKVNYVVLNRLLGMLGSSSNASDDTRRSFADNESGTSARVNDHVSVLVNEVCFIHEGVSSTVQLRRLP
ncbi:MAG: hypothetical protein U0892_04315 [Pirellulales bacterium]